MSKVQSHKFDSQPLVEDQYGNKIGKKHRDAIFKFSDSHWMTDARTTLKTLLSLEIGQKAFVKFLKTEYGKIDIDTYLEFQKLENMDMRTQSHQAMIIYRKTMGTGCRGMSSREIECASADVWEQVSSGVYACIEDALVMRQLSLDADLVLGMLAFDAFPRFINCQLCTQSLMDIRNSNVSSKLDLMIREMRDRAPRDAEEWLNSFVAVADSYPACIVITDMTIAGGPMIYINPSFSLTTGYSFDEAVGRNCRFLQVRNFKKKELLIQLCVCLCVCLCVRCKIIAQT